MDIALPGGPPRMGTEAQNRPQMQGAAESLTPSPQRTLHAMLRVSGGLRTPKPPDSWGIPGQEPWYNGPFQTLIQQGQCPLAPPWKAPWSPGSLVTNHQKPGGLLLFSH